MPPTNHAARLREMAEYESCKAGEWHRQSTMITPTCGYSSAACARARQVYENKAAALLAGAEALEAWEWKSADTAPKGSIPFDCGYRGTSKPFIGKLKNGEVRKIHRLPEDYSFEWADQDKTFYAADWLIGWMPLPEEEKSDE